MKMTVAALVGMIVASAFTGCQTVPPPPPPGPHDGAPVMAISVAPQTTAVTPLAQKLQLALESGAIQRGFAISTVLRPDVTVGVALSRRETARLQDWRTYEGEALVRVVTAADGAVIGTTTITATGARGADEKSAEASLSHELNAKVDAWVGQTVRAERIVKLPAGN